MKKIFYIISLSIFLFPTSSFAAMSSTNYTIYSDSIGMDGGSYSNSDSYALQDTIGESPAGSSSNSTYEVRGGYQFADRGLLSLTVSKTNIGLGNLSPSAVNSDSTVLTVTSDSITGYSLSLANVAGAVPFTVTGGEVTAGADEYGVSASGVDSALSGDVAVTEGLIVASANSARANSATTLTFKASIAVLASSAVTYQQSMTVTAAANF